MQATTDVEVKMLARHRIARPLRAVAFGSTFLLAGCGGATGAQTQQASVPASSAPSASASASSSASAKPSSGSAAKPAASAAAAKVTVAYSSMQGDNLAAWVANEAGIFRKNGLDVDLQLIAGGSKTMGALLSGQVQVAILGGSEAVSAAAEGADLIIVATPTPVFPYKFEVAKEIKTPADLKGKKVGVASIGGSADVATRVALRKEGLDPNKDVNIISLSDSQTRSTALLTGAVQAGMDSPPGTLKLEAAGLHPLMDLASEQIPEAQDVMVAQRSWLAGNHATAQKVVDSLIQGAVRAKQDKTFSLGVLKKYYKDDNEANMSTAYDFYTKEVITELPYPKPEQFKDAMEQLSSKNDKLKTFDVSKILDDSLVKDAAARGLNKA